MEHHGSDECKFKGLNIGQWVAVPQRAFKVSPRRELNLSKARIDLLEQTFHDWSWDLTEDIWSENFET